MITGHKCLICTVQVLWKCIEVLRKCIASVANELNKRCESAV